MSTLSCNRRGFPSLRVPPVPLPAGVWVGSIRPPVGAPAAREDDKVTPDEERDEAFRELKTKLLRAAERSGHAKTVDCEEYFDAVLGRLKREIGE